MEIEKSKNNLPAWFEEAPKIHNNYYDYSKAEFCGMCEEITIFQINFQFYKLRL
jgi:hypothetical protein